MLAILLLFTSFVPHAIAQPDSPKQPQLASVAIKAVQNGLNTSTPAQFPHLADQLKAEQQFNAQKALEAQQALDAQNAIKSSYTAPTQPTDASNPMLQIFMRESGNNPSAINASSGACGLGQALPCSKMPCSLSDYNCQVNFFTSYAVSRYGSWDNAWSFWQQHNWW